MLQKFKHNEMWCLPMQPWGRVVVDSFIVLSCVVVLPGEGGGDGVGGMSPTPLSFCKLIGI